ncbi:MAG: hypothetical protein ACLR6J_14050 [Parabacteroides merdae]
MPSSRCSGRRRSRLASVSSVPRNPVDEAESPSDGTFRQKTAEGAPVRTIGELAAEAVCPGTVVALAVSWRPNR